jgi:hypothetical protein
MNRIANTGMQMVTIFCWSSGSNVTIYSGSHSHRLEATPAPNGLLKIPDEALEHDDIQHCTQDMDCGGL